MSEQFSTTHSNLAESGSDAQEVLRQSPDAVEEPEMTVDVIGNPRIQKMIAERDAAQRQLNEAILDLHDREKSPEFQEARMLLERIPLLRTNLTSFSEGKHITYCIDLDGDNLFVSQDHISFAKEYITSDIEFTNDSNGQKFLAETLRIQNIEKMDLFKLIEYTFNIIEEE
jgi:hypothetical protein